jgi:glycosyltransferase involved in cell wall biosynthesis
VLANVASFSAEKGHAPLLDAFAEVRRCFPRARLLLAGDGPLRMPMEEKARVANLLPAAIFAGHVYDLNAVFAACDVFVFPSLNEGLGTSLLAAMACALPVVAFDRGGIADAVADGRNGLLVRDANAGAIAEAAARLLREPPLALKLGEAARKTILARFTVDRMVEQTLAVFARLAGAERPVTPR